MPKIQDQKLLYHLTTIANLSSILQFGLLARADLVSFADVADHDILEGRAQFGLENYVPFHWFAGNPFDGRVQLNHPTLSFVIITVHRTLAARENWKVVPCHPLSGGSFELLSYEDGIKAIDWEIMDLRTYREPNCRSVCMAECLSPRKILANEFFKIFVRDEKTQLIVANMVREKNLRFEVTINSGMFVNGLPKS